MASLIKQLMQPKNLKYLVAVVLAAVLIVGFSKYNPAASNPETDKKDRMILDLVTSVLTKHHFSPKAIDDTFSAEVFTNFLESLDYNKRFLLQTDIDKLEKHRYQIDDQIKAGSLAFFNEALAITLIRMENSKTFYQTALANPFTFDEKKFIETDSEKLAFAANESALQERWKDLLQYRVMNRIYDKLRDDTDDDTTVVTTEDQSPSKSFAELEAEAREKEMETHSDWFKNMDDLEHIDWLGMYINAITGVFDPHTEYFPPRRQEDFEIEMSGQLEGIGAQLSQKGDYITVEKVVSGSASWRQGELEVGDKILAVAQGDEEPVDVVGMSIRKAVKLIRGKKGTEVRLTVRKKDNTKKEIPIIRDIVELEATFARSSVLGDREKVGYIKLPKFYVDFYNESNHNCAEDIKSELEKLQAAGVESVILDLRGNGGGSLQAVVDIVGLFVGKGPVVQVKTSDSPTKVLQARNAQPVWTGPLVVMVNDFSASASEIFAAAIQDYKRGIIIGSKSTFGKGTVQNIFDLDRAVSWTNNDMKPLGAIKLTIQKYYRINGGTPQLKGVTPDIILPDNYNYIDFGEREQKHALPYNEIAPAKYSIWTAGRNNGFKKAISASQKRVGSNPRFTQIDEYAKWLHESREESLVPLNFDDYRAYQDELRTRSKAFRKLGETDAKVPVAALPDMLAKMEADSLKHKEMTQWHKSVAKDLYIQEAMTVAKDLR